MALLKAFEYIFRTTTRLSHNHIRNLPAAITALQCRTSRQALATSAEGTRLVMVSRHGSRPLMNVASTWWATANWV